VRLPDLDEEYYYNIDGQTQNINRYGILMRIEYINRKRKYHMKNTSDTDITNDPDNREIAHELYTKIKKGDNRKTRKGGKKTKRTGKRKTYHKKR